MMPLHSRSRALGGALVLALLAMGSMTSASATTAEYANHRPDKPTAALFDDTPNVVPTKVLEFTCREHISAFDYELFRGRALRTWGNAPVVKPLDYINPTLRSRLVLRSNREYRSRSSATAEEASQR